MMPVTRPPETAALSVSTQALLKARQAVASTYKTRSKDIQDAWKALHKEPAWVELQSQLKAIFHDKCAYCEIIVPRDVEHYYPKSKYPEYMFQWTNMLFVCKNCDTDKGQKFPVEGGHRDRPLLINPCEVDPALYITWDLQSGRPVPTADPGRKERGLKTLGALPQLKHQSLADERRTVARNFRFILEQALEESPTPADVVAWLEDDLTPQRPWRSVRRQIVRDPANRALIDRVRAKVPRVAPMLDELLGAFPEARAGGATGSLPEEGAATRPEILV